MIYFMDTNIFSYIIKGNKKDVLEKFQSVKVSQDLRISAVVAYEIEYGLQRMHDGKRKQQYQNYFELMLKANGVTITPFDNAAAVTSAKIRTDLENRGMPIGAHDILIAGHALSAQATLITNNLGEFSRVPGLLLENWVTES